MTILRSRIVRFAFFGVIAASPFAFLMLAGSTLEWRDTVRLYAPLRREVVEALWGLHLPLWNAYEGLGMPLFAQMIHGVLHPVSLVTALIAPHASLDLLIAADIALAAAGAALLARGIGASYAGAAVAGFGYALSGYVLSMSANLVYLTCAATAPWTIAALLATAERGGAWIALGGAMVAVAWFGGDPQWALVSLLLGGAFAAETAGLRGLLRVGCAAIIGTVMAGIQLVPASTFLGETMRGLELASEERLQWALPPWRLVEFVAPGFFSGRAGSELVSPVFRVLGGDQQWFFIPFSASVHVGIIPLVLGAAGIRSGRKGTLLAVASLVFLWLALGTHAGADQLLRHLPVWGSFRYSEKLVGPFTLCVAVLAGLGADRIPDFAGRWKPAAIAFLVFLVLTAFLVLSGGHWLPWEPLVPAASQVVRGRLATGLLFTALSLAIMAAVIGITSKHPVFRTRLPAVFAGLIFLVSVAAAPFALHISTPGLIDTNMLKRILPGDSFIRLMHPVEVMDGDGPAMLDKSDRLQVMESSMAKSSYNVWSSLDSYDVYTGLMPRRYTEIDVGLDSIFHEMRWQTIRRFACSHVILPAHRRSSTDTTVHFAVEGGNRIDTPASSGIEVWAVPHRPWAFFARQVISAGTEDEARRLLIDSLIANRDDVVVEGSSPGPRAGGRIFSVQRAAGSITIGAESDGPGLLVLNDAWWPGWAASIDGRPVAIKRADALIRSVEWPPGRHQLTMRYDPPELRYGLLVSAAGLLAVVALLIHSAWRAHRPKV